MNFCTSIHCMDGRIQLPIINFLKSKYEASYVDAITEPGPCKLLAENKDNFKINSILERINISVDKHNSNLIAISGHYDCAGNPCSADTQKTQVNTSINFLQTKYPEISIIGLWINSEWEVELL